MKETTKFVTTAVVALFFSLSMAPSLDAAGEGHSSGPKTTLSPTSNSGKLTMPSDTSNGPAFRTVSGKLVQIKDSYYDVEEYTGNMVRLHVSNTTVMIGGKKKVGDRIRAEVTRGGHANSIQ